LYLICGVYESAIRVFTKIALFLTVSSHLNHRFTLICSQVASKSAFREAYYALDLPVVAITFLKMSKYLF
jgi:hypothetical protein